MAGNTTASLKEKLSVVKNKDGFPSIFPKEEKLYLLGRDTTQQITEQEEIQVDKILEALFQSLTTLSCFGRFDQGALNAALTEAYTILNPSGYQSEGEDSPPDDDLQTQALFIDPRQMQGIIEFDLVRSFALNHGLIVNIEIDAQQPFFKVSESFTNRFQERI